ncbi:uncharacterized protein [Procambarus clarkii]|uniref:uncharacterized protein n=1 Tax=Procambarus clarkii TaxID=6728 RepID=UPI001E671BDF|nr:uncharacterized protein LOC123762584 [Procambarus clarkii]
MGFYDADPPLASHTPLHLTMEYPIHNPRHEVSSTPGSGRPRKYYLTGVMEEMPRESDYGQPHVRKYYLQADTKEMFANDKEIQVTSNEIEDYAQAYDLNAVLPPSHNTVAEPPTTHSPLDSLTLTRFSPYFPPTGYDQPPPSNDTPFTYHRPASHNNPDPPPAFRKYYLLTSVPEPHSPATATDEDDVLDSPEEFPRDSHKLSSFDIYEMLRQPRNASSRKNV